MGKLMILGAGIYQLPAIKSAKELGHTVITVDNIPNNIGHKYSDFCENVSTIDTKGVLEVARKHKIDGIMTIASDIALPVVSFVGEKLELQTLNRYQAEIMSSKPNFRYFLQTNKLPSPEFCEATTWADIEMFFKKVGPPLFIKPSDRSGSKGVAKANSLNELFQYFPKALEASLKGSVCVERFLDGIEVGCEAFCFEGKVEIIAITNKRLTDSHVVCGHSLPCKLSSESVKQVKEITGKVIKALDIRWGPVNLDIILTKDGPYVIDIGGRIGGNGLPQIVRFSTEINTLEMAIEFALGEKPKVPDRVETIPAGVRIFGAAFKAILKSYTDPNMVCLRFSEIIELAMDYESGQRVNAFSEGRNRIGHVIAKGKAGQDIDSVLDSIEKALNFQYEPC